MPKLEITTPEQVVFRHETAGLVSRALAWAVDETIMFSCYAAVIVGCGKLGAAWGSALIMIGMFIIDFAYFTLFEIYRSGQTPGKRMFSLRVISAHGTRLRFADAMIRNLFRPVDNLPWMMVVGGTVAFLDPRHRRLGDMAAETVVVRDVKRTLPAALAAQKTRVNSFQADKALQTRILTRITRDERDLVLDLAIRRDELDPTTREALFAQAANHFKMRFGLPEDLHHLSDEQTVLNLALVVQDAKFTG